MCTANVVQGGFSQAGHSCLPVGNPDSPTAGAAFLFQGHSSALPGHIETGVILGGITLSFGHCSVWKGEVGVPVLSGQAKVPWCLLTPREATACCLLCCLPGLRMVFLD